MEQALGVGEGPMNYQEFPFFRTLISAHSSHSLRSGTMYPSDMISASAAANRACYKHLTASRSPRFILHPSEFILAPSPAHLSASAAANCAVPSAFGILTFQRKLNRPDNAVDVVHDLVVPKADYFIAKCFKIFCAFCVVFDLFQVLTAIQFEDEILFDAHEIWDEVTDGVLSSEIDAELIVTNVCP